MLQLCQSHFGQVVALPLDVYDERSKRRENLLPARNGCYGALDVIWTTKTGCNVTTQTSGQLHEATGDGGSKPLANENTVKLSAAKIAL
ncbi:hypothetical protein V9T40_000913 [Parthenolecanium corni]|uniref:Uncharacterized protein n=1 Tax=Parthenolecanium corni TaxID=536013 RepID=A0AAN9TDX7_9HEMI